MSEVDESSDGQDEETGKINDVNEVDEEVALELPDPACDAYYKLTEKKFKDAQRKFFEADCIDPEPLLVALKELPYMSQNETTKKLRALLMKYQTIVSGVLESALPASHKNLTAKQIQNLVENDASLPAVDDTTPHATIRRVHLALSSEIGMRCLKSEAQSASMSVDFQAQFRRMSVNTLQYAFALPPRSTETPSKISTETEEAVDEYVARSGAPQYSEDRWSRQEWNIEQLLTSDASSRRRREGLKRVSQVWKSLVEKVGVNDSDGLCDEKVWKSMTRLRSVLVGSRKDFGSPSELSLPGRGREGAGPCLMGLVECVAATCSFELDADLLPSKNDGGEVVMSLEQRTPGQRHFIRRSSIYPTNVREYSKLKECYGMLEHELGVRCLDWQRFFKIGVSSFGTSLRGCPAFFRLYQLRLEITETLELKLLASKPLPLMDEESVETWVGKCGKGMGGTLQRLRKHLYGKDCVGNKGMDEEGVPMGLRVIWEILSKPTSDLRGPDYSTLFDNLSGGIIMRGAFGIWFEHGDNQLLQVPAQPWDMLQENELGILEALGRVGGEGNANDDVGVCLPMLVGTREIGCHFGGFDRVLTGLVLEPRGKFLSSLPAERLTVEFLTMVGSQIESALKYMHDRMIHHNCVTPWNIIFEASSRPVLIGFGFATQRKGMASNGNAKKKVGTKMRGKGWVWRHYAHDDAFRHESGQDWYPKDEHDLASLGFTMTAMLTGGDPKWSMNGRSTDSDCTNRFEIAKEILDEHAAPAEWLEWITSERERKRKRDD